MLRIRLLAYLKNSTIIDDFLGVGGKDYKNKPPHSVHNVCKAVVYCF